MNQIADPDPTTPPDRRNTEAPFTRLVRQPLAAKIATLIGSYRGRESLVVAVEGPWGAAKASFTSLVLKEVEARKSATILPFNPWSLSDQNELVAEFFSALAAALGAGTNETPSRESVSYASRLRATAMRSLSVAVRASAGLRDVFRPRERSTHEARGDVYAKLGAIPGRVLVVIDDIDRLDAVQTRLLMKLVRIAATLPNIVFLLVYDRARVAASLEEDGRPGEDLLKTIVHIAFTLPEPSRQELNSVLFAQLRETVSRAHGGNAGILDDDERWQEVVHARLPALFRSIADVGGFMCSLKSSWTIVGTEEVNAVDFVGIEAIRFFAPHLYAAIAANRTLFTGMWRSGDATAADDSAERQARFEDVLHSAPEAMRPALDAVCRYLFPHVVVPMHGTEQHDEWRRDRRVCAESIFPAYFQLGIAEAAVSETEVLFLRRRFESAAAVTALLRQYLADGRLGPLLSLLATQATLISASDAKSLLLGLWAMEADIARAHGTGGHADDVAALAVHFARTLLRDAVDDEHRAPFVHALIDQTQAVAYPSELVAALRQQVETSAQDGEPPLMPMAEVDAAQARLTARLRRPASAAPAGP